MVCSHVVSNSVLFAESGDTTSLFTNKEGSSSERRMEGGIADETSMPPLKCECFGSAAQGQPPSWVHTGLTASSMNVKCQTKHENRPSLYCSFSSHQKSVSAHDKSPPDFGSVHELQQQQLRLSLHRSHRHTCCVRVRRVFYNFPWREAAQLMCLAALRFS